MPLTLSTLPCRGNRIPWFAAESAVVTALHIYMSEGTATRTNQPAWMLGKLYTTPLASAWTHIGRWCGWLGIRAQGTRCAPALGAVNGFGVLSCGKPVENYFAHARDGQGSIDPRPFGVLCVDLCRST